MTKNRRGDYLSGVLANISAINAAGSPPGVFYQRIEHDGWCNLLKRKGECNCNPTVCAPVRLNKDKLS